VDPLWLVIPAAVALFLARTAIIARKLKIAASNPTLVDTRAFRDAREGLRAHRAPLDEAVAAPKGQLEAAKRLSRSAPRARVVSRVARMVEDAGHERGA